MVKPMENGITIIKMDKNGPKEILKIIKEVEDGYSTMKTE
tara:strand:+ start:1517 stop:1636 length:120 start_codon:yes stop_codon:yes gene_type:complete